ncbi:CoB--CoM heterodisulfide reductase iron-sulfur subunit A family protein [Heliorestis acidaminivorans]|uniref:CoB--CoM heterodisulfide reductase iron-sulfur subunit A family protein n=1 Tax=Heliorestis acidaminivorans TaxID=553427 RepID=A0A6I0FAQ5_9FIRM|nr:CoB--CoM heterodisulfide reductase iron-sulfur subunit A family protein [Heliorestis acidaminivorans]KAB2954568.1 CoB--CoM heterodisulfide reductase iron-sulfur subunit A family protein [Heliorestis acidaminivorans]
MKRIGVFVCHCGTNIANTVHCDQVAEVAKDFPGVVYSCDYKYMCAEPGQQLIQDAVREHNLDGYVVAACSPRMHEPTFRKCAERAGLNPYMIEQVNIREQCSWVHADKEKGTEKSIDLLRMAVAKARKNEPLSSSTIPVTKRALVIGAGIAGIQTAIDIADNGFQVTLLDREHSIGGRMAQVDKTFPTLDCSACILTPKMVEAAQHPNIEMVTYAEVTAVDGFVGNFDVTIRKKARYVDFDKCTGCGACQEKCPKKVSSEFEMGLGPRKAIYVPFPQAVPNKPVIDAEHCRYLLDGKCGVCKKICPTEAVDYEQKDEVIVERYGSIVVATGFDQFDISKYEEYGAGRYPDVITGLHLERLMNASGPTAGKIKRPSDGKVPEKIVFIKCVGSRDEAKGRPYCSKACCMYVAKHATLIKEKMPQSKSYIFYMDVRTGGKSYEEFYKRTQEQYDGQYIRGRVSKIFQVGDKLIVRGEDSLIGRPVEIEADLVVLAAGMEPRADAVALARTLGISYDQHGWYTEAHPKLQPIETHTAGIYLAGVCQGPKDIPESVAQASAAAVKATGLLSKGELTSEAMIAECNEAVCAGCGLCISVCPYKAIEKKKVSERVHGQMKERVVAVVNPGLCQGCGACTVNCPSSAMNINGFTNEQILAEVDALCQR